MADREMDQKLFVQTTGLREWRGAEAADYNRTESTPYRGLDELFRFYTFHQDDVMVDFGCGRGRVLFYTHYLHDIPVTGIELNDLTFDELHKNKETYLAKNPESEQPVTIHYGYADDYEVSADENIFFFFNPFALNIFKRVIQNIVRSLKEDAREVDIIMYYPLGSFKRYIEEHTDFRRIQTVRLPWKLDRREKFVIYRYTPEELENTGAEE